MKMSVTMIYTRNGYVLKVSLIYVPVSRKLSRYILISSDVLWNGVVFNRYLKHIPFKLLIALSILISHSKNTLIYEKKKNHSWFDR